MVPVIACGLSSTRWLVLQLEDGTGADMWIALFDERLSTHAVNDFLVNDVDMSRTKRDQIVDKLAARLILQGALDYMTVHRSP